MSYENLKPLVEALGDLDTQIKIMTKKRDEIKKEVSAVLADQGAKQFGRYQVKVTTSPGRKTLDKDALETAGIDLSPYYKVGKPYTTTTIKVVDVE